jgi:hypothetical protein
MNTVELVRAAHPSHPVRRTPVAHRVALRLGLALVLWGRGYRLSREDLARHVVHAKANERRERAAERHRLLLPPR